MPFPGFIEAVPGGVRGKTPHDRKVLADQESSCLTVNMQPENEAAQALDEIRSRAQIRPRYLGREGGLRTVMTRKVYP